MMTLSINALKKHIPVLLIILLGLIVYTNSFFNQFVLDDPSQILTNPLVHSIKNIPTLFLGSSFGGGNSLSGLYYKPLMTTCFTILYSLFGANPFPFHFFQVILHILNVILVFILLRHIFTKNMALIISLVFLVHPVNVDAVSYISAFQDTLYMFFGLFAIVIASKSSMNMFDYILYVCLLSLSLLSKETGVLFIFTVLIYRMLFIEQNRTKVSLIKRYKTFLTINLTILSCYIALRYLAVGVPLSKDLIFPITRLSFAERLINIPAILFYYFKTAFFPRDLAVGQQWIIKSINFQDFYLPLILDATFFIIIILFGRKLYKDRKYFKAFLFFLTWLVLGLGIHLQLVPLDATVADRWFYFPLIGLLGIAGVVTESLENFKLRNIYLVSIVIIIAFSLRTIVRNTNWTNGLILASHDIQVTKDSFVLENNLGYELINAGLYDEAEIHIKKSTELAPYWWLNWNNLGVVYRHKGSSINHNQNFIDKAESSFRKAIENTNTFYLPYENLAELLLNFADPNSAIDFIHQTSNKMPLDSLLWYDLALSYYKVGNYQQAIEAAEQAYLLNPKDEQSSKLYQALLSNDKRIILQTPAY